MKVVFWLVVFVHLWQEFVFFIIFSKGISIKIFACHAFTYYKFS